jgi:outer membrane protein assembly factor BamB
MARLSAAAAALAAAAFGLAACGSASAAPVSGRPVTRSFAAPAIAASKKKAAAFSASSASPLSAPIPPGWPTEHHDIRNSGRAEHDGPADGDGVCRYTFYDAQSSPFASDEIDLLATGVTSIADENANLFAGTDNVLRIARLGPATLDTWSCDLNVFTNRTAGKGPATNYGVVGSGATWTFTNGGILYDRYAVGSSDGSVYAFNWEACALGAGGKQAICNHTIDNVPTKPVGSEEGEKSGAPRSLRASEQALSLGGGPACLQFAMDLPGTNPVYSPVRYLGPLFSGSPAGGIILVSTTDANLDQGGALHALDADTGALLWSFQAQAYIAGAFTSVGLRGVVPAVDSARGYLIYLAFGPRIVALSPSTGAVVSSFNVSSVGGDGFVSSPVLSSDNSAMYLHSAVGSVWRIAINGGATPTFSIDWSCDYTIEAYKSKTSTCTTGAASSLVRVPTYAWDPATGRRSLAGSRLVPRTDFVPGGWNQLMTRDERDALFRDLEADAAPALAALAPSERDAIASLSSAEERAAAHASLLTDAQLDAIGSENGGASHARLDASGRPRWVARAFLGEEAFARKVGAAPPSAATFPYATPALTASDTHVAVPQFLAFGSGDEALFVSTAATGEPVWAFVGIVFNDVLLIPFGRSRSSPVVDMDGGLYVGADVDWVNNDTRPSLFAWQPTDPSGSPDGGYSLRWVDDMGLMERFTVGASSPVVKKANSTQNEVIMAAGDNINGFREGKACLTNNPEVPCSDHGVCNCFTGFCECDVAWRGAADCSKETPAEPAEADNDLAPGAAAMVGVTLGTMGVVIGGAMLIGLAKAYGLPKGMMKCLGLRPTPDYAGQAGSSGGTYGSTGTSSSVSARPYDMKPLVPGVEGSGPESVSLLSAGH